MKAASSASLQLFGTVVAISAIVGLGWTGHAWLTDKFSDFDKTVAALKENVGKDQAEQSKQNAIRLTDMQRQIDNLRAGMKIMNVAQPKPMQQLVRDVMVDKSMPQSAMSRRPGYDKGVSASSTAVHK
jgi:Tfp pilus assembly protein PilO